MELVDALGVFYKLAREDSAIGPSHLAIYGALLFIFSEQKQLPIYISRKVVMELAHIRGIATYQKCVSELHTHSYIIYTPSFDPRGKSRVYLKLATESKIY